MRNMQQGEGELTRLFPALTTLRLELSFDLWGYSRSIKDKVFAPSDLWSIERQQPPNGKAKLEVSLFLFTELFTMRPAAVEDETMVDYMDMSILNNITYKATPSADQDAFCGLELATVSAWTYDHDALMAEARTAME